MPSDFPLGSHEGMVGGVGSLVGRGWPHHPMGGWAGGQAAPKDAFPDHRFPSKTRGDVYFIFFKYTFQSIGKE